MAFAMINLSRRNFFYVKHDSFFPLAFFISLFLFILMHTNIRFMVLGLIPKTSYEHNKNMLVLLLILKLIFGTICLTKSFRSTRIAWKPLSLVIYLKPPTWIMFHATFLATCTIAELVLHRLLIQSPFLIQHTSTNR